MKCFHRQLINQTITYNDPANLRLEMIYSFDRSDLHKNAIYKSCAGIMLVALWKSSLIYI